MPLLLLAVLWQDLPLTSVSAEWLIYVLLFHFSANGNNRYQAVYTVAENHHLPIKGFSFYCGFFRKQKQRPDDW